MSRSDDCRRLAERPSDAQSWRSMAPTERSPAGIPELPEPGSPGPFALADAQRTRACSSPPGGRRSPSRSTRTRCASDATPEGVVPGGAYWLVTARTA